jgi:hypothetical protein
MRRPCAPADLVDVTPVHKGGWGPPLPFDPTPWEATGEGLGFEFAFTVRSDADWDRFHFDPENGEALRYVLVPVAGE